MIKELIREYEEKKEVIFEEVKKDAIHSDFELKDLITAIFVEVEHEDISVSQLTTGGYTGENLFVIANRWGDFKYIIKLEYGSCSGCDTFISALDTYQYDKDFKDLETLCLHIIQRTKDINILD